MIGKSAVIDLPLRLTVVVLIVSLTTPVALAVMEEQEIETARTAMDRSASSIMNAAIATHYGGEGSFRTLELHLPPGCTLEVGGEAGSVESLSIRCYYEGRLLGTRYMESHSISLLTDTPLTLEGDPVLVLQSLQRDEQATVGLSVR